MGEFQKRVERAVVAFCGEPSKYDEALLREGADTFRSIASEIAKEADDRITTLEAEKAERERQEPVAWAWNDPAGWMHIQETRERPEWISDEMADGMKLRPLYAHPLALREPTEDECQRIANEFLILGGPDELAGRVMFNAVREVMTK